MKNTTLQVFNPAAFCLFQGWIKVIRIFTMGILALSFQLITTSTIAQYTKLHDFALQPDGMHPFDGLISDGTFLYGTTAQGGTTNVGTIFKIKPDGTGYAKLHNFAVDANGRVPQGTLISDGTFLYGMTSTGSTNDAGTIFKIKLDGTDFTKLWEFGVGARNAIGSLISDGTFLYGMSQNGGINDHGIIFKIKTDGTGYVKLLDFDITNGRNPFGDLLYDGTFLYGMTQQGGTNNLGVIFKIKPDGSGYAKLFDFSVAANGRSPQGSLISDGTFLYGMTPYGGANNFGVIFKIKPDGTGYLKLLDFDEIANGSIPTGALFSDGAFLYGMAYAGGTGGFGTIFKIKHDGTGYAKLLDFADVANGRFPRGSLISDGSFLYGMAWSGGTSGYGTVFKYAIPPTVLPSIANFTPTNGPVGTTVTITGTNFSTTPADNIVRFNGITAIVTASAVNSITTTVPAGASTGAVTITVSANTATSASNFIVTVPSITITSHPANYSACVGGVATFAVAATGAANIRYQWQFATSVGGPYNDLTNGGGYSNVSASALSVNTMGNFGAGSYRCKVSGDLAVDKFSNAVSLTVNSVPASPSTTGATSCMAMSFTLTASDGSSGQYRWYNIDVGGTSIARQTNNTYVTSAISTSTTYYVAINNGLCESSRTPVIAAIVPISKPAITSSKTVVSNAISLCEGESLILTTAAGFPIYKWSNGAATQQITIDKSGVYNVVVTDASGCVSPPSDQLTITVNPSPVSEILLSGSHLLASPGDSYQWYYFDEPVVGAVGQSFEINSLKYGEYAVDVTDNGCTSHSNDFVYLVSGNEGSNNSTLIKVYPNSTQKELFIQVTEQSTLTMFDLMGRYVKSINLQPAQLNRLETNNLTSGTYMLTIRSVNKINYFKIHKID